jgi:hypothetical protein
MTFDDYTKDMPTEWPEDSKQREQEDVERWGGEIAQSLSDALVYGSSCLSDEDLFEQYLTHKKPTDPKGEKYYPMDMLIEAQALLVNSPKRAKTEYLFPQPLLDAIKELHGYTDEDFKAWGWKSHGQAIEDLTPEEKRSAWIVEWGDVKTIKEES